MGTLTKNFHSICIDCRGTDCGLDNRCAECLDITDDIMTMYVGHRKRLKQSSSIRVNAKTLPYLILLLTILRSSAIPFIC